MFNFVIDVNEKGAKGKPFKMTFDKLSDEIDLSYDVDGISVMVLPPICMNA